jgi:hypothetical protein
MKDARQWLGWSSGRELLRWNVIDVNKFPARADACFIFIIVPETRLMFAALMRVDGFRSITCLYRLIRDQEAGPVPTIAPKNVIGLPGDFPSK